MRGFIKWRTVKWIVGGLAIGGLGMAIYTGEVWVPTKIEQYSAPEIVAPVVKKEELAKVPVEVLENKLDEIIWGGESEKYVMKPGELYPTFDPNSTEYAKCVVKHGWMPDYCISWGPRKIKMSMIKDYWPQVYGEKLTDMEYLQIITGNESSKKFVIDCAVKVKGCVTKWTTAVEYNAKGEAVALPEIQMLVDVIREAKGIKFDK